MLLPQNMNDGGSPSSRLPLADNVNSGDGFLPHPNLGQMGKMRMK